MMSKELALDYWTRTIDLTKFFVENISKAENLLVEGYESDDDIQVFFKSVFLSISEANLLMAQFPLIWGRKPPRHLDTRELVEEFNSLEKDLASQNAELQRLSKKKEIDAPVSEGMCALVKNSLFAGPKNTAYGSIFIGFSLFVFYLLGILSVESVFPLFGGTLLITASSLMRG